VLGFEHLPRLYYDDQDFGVLFEACLKHSKGDFHIQDRYLFKGGRLCVPKCGTRELILREIHGGSLAGHLREDKTFLMAKEHYYWPRTLKDIKDILKRYSVCQMAKSHSLAQGLYTPLPTPHRSWLDVSMDFVLDLPRANTTKTPSWV